MILIIFKTIIAWIILTITVTNLLALILRCLFYSPLKHKIQDPTINEAGTKRTNNIVFSVVFAVTVLFYYALYYFFNFGIAISAAMLMFSRFPDLLFDIGPGDKPGIVISVLTKIIFFVALPVIFLSFYYLKYNVL